MSTTLPDKPLDKGVGPLARAAHADTARAAERAAAALVPPMPAAVAPDFIGLWTWVMRVAWVILGFLLFDEACIVLMDLWLFESLGLDAVFWTNFEAGALLFLVGVVGSGFIIGPAYACKLDPGVRRVVRHVGLMVGVVSGWLLAQEYLTFLMSGGRDFGQVDNVFGNDIAFYIFTLEPLWVAWRFLMVGTVFGLASWIFCGLLATRHLPIPAGMSRVTATVGRAATLGARVTVGVLGVLVAAYWWLDRYDVLIADNSKSSIYNGASYVDVVGLFSTVNDYIVTAFVALGVTAAALIIATHVSRAVRGGGRAWWPAARRPAYAIAILILVDLVFKGTVAVRHEVAVKPNEPVIQIPFITEHINATRAAYDLGDVETVRFIPNQAGDPMPDIERLMSSTTFQNAPLWPGFASYLEELVDIQHADRIMLTRGDPLVYGPMLDIFRQEQKLRAYYNFLDLDTTRYTIDGAQQMVVSAVREVPLVEPQPWLAWWGQQYILYTHGYGLIAAMSAPSTPQGGPVYLASGIPVTSRAPILQPASQRVYYGEGSGSMAYSNVQNMEELDYPTDEGRATLALPADVNAGVKIDSFLKRLVLGWKSGQFFEVVFSDLIDDETRVHFFRTPLERVRRVAPFLYLDSDPHAFTTDDGRIVWMVNGMTWADRYPYSQFQDLGDKSDRRSRHAHPQQRMNYVRDSVKATVDAYTGQVTLYLFDDEPIAGTLADIYPSLFRPRSQMPPDVRSQLKYPLQLLHVQFDDLYILYQQKDPMTYFNMEDMWDDGDEVLGPTLAAGGAIRFSIEPFSVMVEANGDTFPKAAQTSQFALAMLFTPEGARNLRAVPVVYQDGEDYGRVVSLQVPKGTYIMGPEQADSAIDQEPSIAQQFSWWNRRGLEVIRGHTTALIVANELIYVEPIFLRSQQNPLTQMKQIAVVYRGRARMAATLREALAAAMEASRLEGAPAP